MYYVQFTMLVNAYSMVCAGPGDHIETEVPDVIPKGLSGSSCSNRQLQYDGDIIVHEHLILNQPPATSSAA